MHKRRLAKYFADLKFQQLAAGFDYRHNADNWENSSETELE